MSEDKLEGWVRELQRGRTDRLDDLVRATQGQAFRLACALLQDSHLSEDALQDVYMIVYEKIGQLRRPEAFRGWFRRILVNHCRKLLRWPTHVEWEDQPAPAPSPGPSHVGDALEQLSSADRAVLALREIEELTYEEIADALDVPVSTIRSRLYKARQRALRLLSPGATT